MFTRKSIDVRKVAIILAGLAMLIGAAFAFPLQFALQGNNVSEGQVVEESDEDWLDAKFLFVAFGIVVAMILLLVIVVIAAMFGKGF